MIAVLDTGVANAASVLYALERLGYKALLTKDPDVLYRSSRVILPGVGSADALMREIQKQELTESLITLKQPVLGICLGMQALYEFSEEGTLLTTPAASANPVTPAILNTPPTTPTKAATQCLGIFPGTVKKLRTTDHLPVPHMGWNQIVPERPSLLLREISDNTYFYFVHSFYVPQGPEMAASTQYGEKIPSIIESKNWFGTQFHPERSGRAGEILLKNFLTL